MIICNYHNSFNWCYNTAKFLCECLQGRFSVVSCYSRISMTHRGKYWDTSKSWGIRRSVNPFCVSHTIPENKLVEGPKVQVWIHRKSEKSGASTVARRLQLPPSCKLNAFMCVAGLRFPASRRAFYDIDFPNVRCEVRLSRKPKSKSTILTSIIFRMAFHEKHFWKT